MRAVLLGPRNDSPQRLKQLLRKIPLMAGDLRIAVDGGVDDWLAIGRPPQMAIGDWDSLRSRSVLDSIAHVTLPKNKNRSDLYHAMALAREMGACDIVALGVTGGRPDHHLASLLELAQASQNGSFKTVWALDEFASYYWVSPVRPLSVSVGRGRVFSVFAASQGAVSGVSITGARYPLRAAKLEPGSQGLSNVAQAAKVRVTVRKGSLLVVVPSSV